MPTRTDFPSCSRADTDPHTRAADTDTLLRRAAEAPAGERHDHHEQVVLLHLEVADALAHRYAGRGAETADLEQVARLALVEAAERADPDRGDFLPFAVTTIRGCLKRYFRDQCWLVRPPRRIQELQADVNEAWIALSQELGHAPSTRELAARVDQSPADVGEAQAAGSCFRPSSLDAPIRTEDSLGTVLGDQLGDLDPGYEGAEWAGTLSRACADLSPEDRRMLHLRFVEERTQQEIADELGVSQMQISRSLRRVLRRLRTRIHAVDEPELPIAA